MDSAAAAASCISADSDLAFNHDETRIVSFDFDSTFLCDGDATFESFDTGYDDDATFESFDMGFDPKDWFDAAVNSGVPSDPPSSRFVAVSEEEIQKDVQNGIPENTRRKAKWAFSLLRAWHNEWKMRPDGCTKVLTEVENWTVGELNECLRPFLCEVRKVNGEFVRKDYECIAVRRWIIIW